jgi:hypothetical protein
MPKRAAAKRAREEEEEEDEEEASEPENGPNARQDGEKDGEQDGLQDGLQDGEQDGEQDDEQEPAPAPPPLRAPYVPKKKRVKRGPKDMTGVIRVGSIAQQDFVLPQSLQDKEFPIRGLRFATAGLLITREDPSHTFHLTQESLKGILDDRGASLGGICSKTDIFIEGAIDREHDKMNPDTWSGSAKQLALAKQLAMSHPPIVMSFSQFVMWFGLERVCFSESSVARYLEAGQAPPVPGGRKNSYKAPGRDGNRGSLMGRGLTWTSEPNQGKGCKPKHNPFCIPTAASTPQTRSRRLWGL